MFLWLIFRSTLSRLLLQSSVQKLKLFSPSPDSLHVKVLLADAVSVLFVVVSCHHHLVVVGTVGQQFPSFPWVADGAGVEVEGESARGEGGGQY